MTVTARKRPRSRGLVSLGLVPLVALAACSSADAGASAAEGPAGELAEASAEATEEATYTPRIAVTYDGGIQVLDAGSLEQVADFELEGFNRINAVGDGRHLLVSTTGGFQVLDGGAWAEPHGDHAHYYTADPQLTDMMFEASTPGHVVAHHGRTVLFDDGTGTVTAFDATDVTDPERETREHRTPEAHHGVAVELADGTLVVTEGNEEERNGLRVFDADGKEMAASDDCPHIHGEATAADEVVLAGCRDGVLMVKDGTITKIDSPDAYGAVGTQVGHEESPVVMGDYESEPRPTRPTSVSLTDTASGTMSVVDLPASYTFRSLARGEHGEGLVLGTDGQIHVIDPEAKKVVKSIPVIDEWEAPEDWQQPRPAIFMLDGSAYVTDPANQAIHAVDIETGEIWNTVELDFEPNEISGISGNVEAGSTELGESDEHGHGEEHAEGKHDHEHSEEGHERS